MVARFDVRCHPAYKKHKQVVSNLNATLKVSNHYCQAVNECPVLYNVLIPLFISA